MLFTYITLDQYDKKFMGVVYNIEEGSKWDDVRSQGRVLLH